MVNLYKLTNLLESGMTIFQLNQWKNEGIWYPITQYKKPSNEIEVVTNVFTPLDKDNTRYHIQLTANYDDNEIDEWKQFLEGNQVENIYHSLEDNQDKAYQDLINQVNATYGDGGVLQFKNIKGIKNYFDSVTIETQELIPIGFKNTLLNRETK